MFYEPVAVVVVDGTGRNCASTHAMQAMFGYTDHGRGVPPELVDHIFERFHQVDVSDSRDKGGTGLGLAICKSIVEEHGGRIWVEETLGGGATLAFTLPLPLPAYINNDAESGGS